jgi:hypothetical protein
MMWSIFGRSIPLKLLCFCKKQERADVDCYSLVLDTYMYRNYSVICACPYKRKPAMIRKNKYHTYIIHHTHFNQPNNVNDMIQILYVSKYKDFIEIHTDYMVKVLNNNNNTILKKRRNNYEIK